MPASDRSPLERTAVIEPFASGKSSSTARGRTRTDRNAIAVSIIDSRNRAGLRSASAAKAPAKQTASARMTRTAPS